MRPVSRSRAVRFVAAGDSNTRPSTRSPVELDTATGWALRPGFSQSRQCPCGCFVNKSGLGDKCRLNRARWHPYKRRVRERGCFVPDPFLFRRANCPVVFVPHNLPVILCDYVPVAEYLPAFLDQRVVILRTHLHFLRWRGHLTIHSSRRRFAARLNSGVRHQYLCELSLYEKQPNLHR